MSYVDTEDVIETESIFDGMTDDTLTETKPTDSTFTEDDKEKRPRKLAARASASTLITLAWGSAGTMLERSGADVPVGRVLQFQAPLAGEKIDKLIANTWIDRVIQPFVAQAEKIEGLGALVMFPLLVGAYERNPAIGEAIYPIMRQVIHETLVDMAPVIKKRAAAEKRAASSISGLHEALGIDKDADPVEAILQSIFRPVEGKEADEAE